MCHLDKADVVSDTADFQVTSSTEVNGKAILDLTLPFPLLLLTMSPKQLRIYKETTALICFQNMCGSC